MLNGFNQMTNGKGLWLVCTYLTYLSSKFQLSTWGPFLYLSTLIQVCIVLVIIYAISLSAFKLKQVNFLMQISSFFFCGGFFQGGK